MNKVILSGNVGKEPIFGVTQNGLEFCRFSLAVRKSFKDNEVDWFRIVAFGKTVTNVVKPFIHKGDRIAVMGELRYDKYEDVASGEERRSLSIMSQYLEILAGDKSNVNKEATEIGLENENYNSTDFAQAVNAQNNNVATPAEAPQPVTDDDIPF